MMKNAICLLILLYANYADAQLKVEQLANDSLMKLFLSQQTGRRFQDLHFVERKELKERNAIGQNSKRDSIGTAQHVIADFNEDGRQDLVVSYAERTAARKYVDAFHVMAFLSQPVGGYEVKDVWKVFDHLYGGIVQLPSEQAQFVVIRRDNESRREKISHDTLRYFQGEFINVGEACVRAFDSIAYYTSSSWTSSSHQYSRLTIFSNWTMKREDFLDGKKKIYTCLLKREVFDSLYKLICQVNLWNLEDRYAITSVLDAGTSHLVVGYQGVVKTIDDYGHFGNFSLATLYDLLNRLSREAAWKLTLPPKIEYKPREMPTLK